MIESEAKRKGPGPGPGLFMVFFLISHPLFGLTETTIEHKDKKIKQAATLPLKRVKVLETSEPFGVAVSKAGELFVSDFHNQQCHQPETFPGSDNPDGLGIALLVNDKWDSTNRQIGDQILQGQLKVYCLVVNADQDDIDDANQHGVTLIQPKKFGLPSDGKIDCLLLWQSYYQDILNNLVKPEKVKVVIGHADLAHEAALDIKKKLYAHSKYISFFHMIPEDCEPWKNKTPTEMKEKEDLMYRHAQEKEVDAIVSVGPSIYEHYSHRLENYMIKHFEFFPYPEPKFYKETVNVPKSHTPKRIRILTFGRVKKLPKLKGYYDLLACAVGKLANASHQFGETVPVWVVCGVPDDEAVETRDFLLKHANSKHLDVKIYPYISHSEIIRELQNSWICLVGSRIEPFGLAGLEAIVMGVPTLITRSSGLANLLLSHFRNVSKQCMVDMPPSMEAATQAFEETADLWKERMLDILKDPEAAFEKADRLKKALQKAAKEGIIYQSQKKFVDYCLQ